jgi:predicted helicase
MFEIEGIHSIKRIKWEEVKTGMIFIGGVTINSRVPDEFRDFPVLTESPLNSLLSKYRFLKKKESIATDTIIRF